MGRSRLFQGANLYKAGYEPNGSVNVITKYLGTTWLWDRVRVVGGAYGMPCLRPVPMPDGRRGTRVLLKGGGWVGGVVGGPPLPAGDPELLEVPKAPKKCFGLN